ncbi:replicative DNA helicase [Parageobacillus thermoglucosidasius]|uniref:replicative DNA helicase n=1 Tax=Parageobacillus thermoglucosidasius TaxID=1426 RepID=UPI0001D1734C|nr:replicative DNA helicase [Parageobacillus thermoglucosidasius]AEH46759.1 DnaB domain protein helicase domain protein [Parageobacillus thermoglucosidasius C56-YS93]
MNWEAQASAERLVLACILKDPSLIEETMLRPGHFIDPRNHEIFRLMLEAKERNEKPDVVTLLMMVGGDAFRLGGNDYLSDLMNTVVDVSLFDKYQRWVKDFNTIDRARTIVGKFMEETKSKADIHGLQKMMDELTKLETEIIDDKQTFQDLLASRLEQHYNTPAKGLSGVDTGFTGLNKFTDGWQPSDLIIIGARPSMGKTALVLNSILNSTKRNDIFGTFFSIEMSKGQIVDRLIAMEGRINLMKMRNPNKTFTDEEWKRYHAAVGVLEKLNIDIRDEYTVPTIRAAIRKNMKQHPDKKHIAAIDFLTLIKPIKETGNTHKDLTDILWDLKNAAKDLNIPIIVLAQLNRGVENRQDKRPNMSDLRESGSIEQIADLIAFLYREDYYNRDAEQKGITEIIIAKNRNGDTGTLYMKFVKETNTFYDVVLQS